MIEISISGGSDDLVEIQVKPVPAVPEQGIPTCAHDFTVEENVQTEEYQHYTGTWRALLTAPDGPGEGDLIACAQFQTGWRIGIENQVDSTGEEYPIPPWPMALRQHRTEPNPELMIIAPDNTRIRILTP